MIHPKYLDLEIVKGQIDQQSRPDIVKVKSKHSPNAPLLTMVGQREKINYLILGACGWLVGSLASLYN